MSVGDLSDVVTTINVPVVALAEFFRGNFFMEWAVSDMLANLEASIFVRKTVGELLFEVIILYPATQIKQYPVFLFEGYEDDVMSIGADMSDNNNNDEDYSSYYGDTNYNYNSDLELDLDLDMDLDMEEEDFEKREAEETRRGEEDKMKMDRFGWFYDVSSKTS